MNGSADERARYWGALNKIRRQGEHTYAVHIAWQKRQYRGAGIVAHRPAGELMVHVSWGKGRWHVCGYSVDAKLIIGIEHDL